MNRRRLQTLLLVAALLFVNAVALLWLQANPIPTAWAGPRAQDTLDAPDVPEAADAPHAIPSSFSYQGILRDPGGELIDGQVDLTINLYTDPIAITIMSSGPYEFQGVNVRDGVFNVVIDLPNTNIFNNEAVFLSVTIGGGAEMLPRQRLHSVPWALQAQTAVSALRADVATKAEKLKSGSTAPQIGGKIKVESYVYSESSPITYQTYLNRAFFRTPTGTETTKYLSLDNTIVNDYCMDRDGCALTLGIVEHAGGAPIILAKDHFFIGGEEEWVKSLGQENSFGKDANNIPQVVWGTDGGLQATTCLLTDSDYPQDSDNRAGFTLVRRSQNTHDCFVIFED